MRGLALVAALSMLSACSLIAVPSVHAEHPEACNPSRVSPVGDLLLGALELSLTAGLLMTTESTSCFNNDCETHDIDNTKPAMVVGTLSVVQLASSVVGFSRTGQCRKLRAGYGGMP